MKDFDRWLDDLTRDMQKRGLPPPPHVIEDAAAPCLICGGAKWFEETIVWPFYNRGGWHVSQTLRRCMKCNPPSF